ncbi:hypothetical protein [Agromyces humi]|uniref:hypothetical protein n=1 Tax=Agromyces humi TaxID=1766800 RepID=UPI00135AE4E1|nr:hypothetical protein [Agromyces humi]
MKKSEPLPASTLADIRKSSERPVRTFVDDTTPDGHFGASAKIVGLATVYILKGELDDPAAQIVERTEYHMVGAPRRYIGRGLKGGQLTLQRD